MTQEFAIYLVAQCEKKKSGTQLLVDDLLALWGGTRGHIYKKIKGEAPISLGEALLAARKYGFSLDEFVAGQSDQVIFRYPTLGRPPKTAQTFLGELQYAMRTVAAVPGTRIRYATNEIPVFYYLLFPELTAFKMYLWSRSVWNSIEGNPPGMDWITALLADSAFRELCLDTFNTFSSIPTHEYYPLNMLDNTLSQIHFLRDTGDVTSKFADQLFAQLLDLTRWMQQAAAVGYKYDAAGKQGEKLELYYNEMLYTNNLILLSNPVQGLLFSTLDNPNFIVTEDVRLVGQMEAWFTLMQKKSTRISVVGERERGVYFQSLLDRITQR